MTLPNPKNTGKQTMPEGKSDDLMEAAIRAVDAAREDLLLAKASDNKALLRQVAISMVHGALLTERQRALWQPIETAPKDGTDIIVYNTSGEGIVGEAYYWNDNGRGGWWWAGTYEGEHMEEPMHIRNAWPTHWQPLPAPPSSTEER